MKNLFRDRVQARHPVHGRFVKLDTRTGRILATKRSSRPWSRIRVIERVAHT